MESVQRLASFLLLFQILFPFIAGVLLTARPCRSEQFLSRGTMGGHLLLAGTSLILLGMIPFLSVSGDPASSIQFTIPLFGGETSVGLLHNLAWRLDLESAAFLCLIPWVALSAQLFTTKDSQSASGLAGNLLLTGAFSLFIAAGDLASLLCGASLSVLLISLRLIRFGGEEKRPAAVQFLTLQFIGGGLLAAGLGMFAASAGITRAAPFGLPGDSSFNFSELEHLIQSGVASHPAAEQLWGEYRILPAGLMLGGLLIMAAGFPMQVWLSEVSASAALGERLWLVAWIKCVLLTGLRLLSALDPEALHGFGWWGLAVSVPGALFVASLLFSQAYLPRIQSSGLAWTQQIALVTVFSATQDLDLWLVPLLICHTAVLVLFTIALTTISERYRSIEISSFQGISSRAGWLIPLLLICTLAMTFTPLSLGLMGAWLVSVTLQGSESLFGLVLRLMYLLADLLAVAGMARVMQQLCTGPLRLPEMSPGLRERTSLPPPTTTLTFSTGQLILLTGWGLLALVMALIFPALRFLTLSSA